jgi:indolepyruvate decarboxylase
MPAVTIADYIVSRLSELGAEHLFGVPGNYTAQFLAAARRSGKLTWVGTTCELEAGYAADAYARLRPIGVACITYGVGSFSLYNAIAGAYVERCPVVLINGTADAGKGEQLKTQGVKFAHAIDTLRTDEYIFRPITAATAVLSDPADAPAEIDRVLRACVLESLPVYLEARDRDWVLECAPPGPWQDVLNTPPQSDAERAARERANKEIDQAVAAAVKDVVARAQQAKSPVLWGGELLQRRGLQNEFEQLVKETRWAYTTTLLGKSLISEKNDRFIGVYDSGFAQGRIREVVEKSDCLIALGTILSNFYGDIVQKQYERMVLASGDAVRVGRYVYPNVPIDRFVRRLLASVKQGVTQDQAPPAGFAELREEQAALRELGKPAGLAAAEEPLTWDNFFARLHQFVRPGKRVLVDTGLTLFPSTELLIEERDHFVAQTAWLSIGYTTGGAVGASFAAKDRVIALAGDGGFQMIPQALSTLARFKKPVIFFVFNNALYAIEQFLVDNRYFAPGSAQPHEFFNELAAWDYLKLAEAFGARGFRASTSAELEQALAAVSQLTDVPALVEVRLDPRDLPAALRAVVSAPAGLAAVESETATVIAPALFN